MHDTPAPAAGGRHRADPGAVDATPRPAPPSAEVLPATAPHRAAPHRATPHPATPRIAVATASGAGRCPSCASRVGPREEWCSLCHAALRPAGAPTRDDVPPAPSTDDPPAATPAAAPEALLVPAAPAAEAELDPEVVEAMLAQLAGGPAEPGLRGLPSTQAKVLVAALGGLGLTGLLLLAMTAAGAVLG